jgi:hypothetical protein
MNLFGPFVNLHDVSRAVRDFHQLWFDTYLCEVERQSGYTPRYYSRDGAYRLVNMLTGRIGDISPVTIIVTRGGNGRPERNGRSYDLPLDIGIAHVTSSFEGDGAREAAGAFAAATVSLMLQQRSLGSALNGRLRVSSWDDIRMDDLPETEQLTRAVLRLEFTVLVKDVVDPAGGPAINTPPADPTLDPGLWPTVATSTTNPSPTGRSTP